MRGESFWGPLPCRGMRIHVMFVACACEPWCYQCGLRPLWLGVGSPMDDIISEAPLNRRLAGYSMHCTVTLVNRIRLSRIRGEAHRGDDLVQTHKERHKAGFLLPEDMRLCAACDACMHGAHSKRAAEEAQRCPGHGR